MAALRCLQDPAKHERRDRPAQAHRQRGRAEGYETEEKRQPAGRGVVGVEARNEAPQAESRIVPVAGE